MIHYAIRRKPRLYFKVMLLPRKLKQIDIAIAWFRLTYMPDEHCRG